jgi:hypothetical protein
MFQLSAAVLATATLLAPALVQAGGKEDYAKVELRGMLTIFQPGGDAPGLPELTCQKHHYNLDTTNCPNFPLTKEASGKTCVIKGTLEHRPVPGDKPPRLVVVVQSFEFPND